MREDDILLDPVPNYLKNPDLIKLFEDGLAGQSPVIVSSKTTDCSILGKFLLIKHGDGIKGFDVYVLRDDEGINPRSFSGGYGRVRDVLGVYKFVFSEEDDCYYIDVIDESLVIKKPHEKFLGKEVERKYNKRKESFKRESMIISELGHSSTFFELNSQERFNRFFIVMDRMPGKNLFSWYEFIKNNFDSFPLRTLLAIIAIAYKVAKDLAYVHEKGFVHRDVRSTNIMVDLDKLELPVYLIDFGSARKITGNSVARSSYTESADIYSLALTFEELLRDCLQLNSETDQTVEGFIDRFKVLLSRASHKNPENRPTLDKLMDELLALSCEVKQTVIDQDNAYYARRNTL